ncbi:MAG TPA: response regulator [Nitrosopumilaceae archaeon]|nr:response regulator [Nitrosopumilaceae archaeon]
MKKIEALIIDDSKEITQMLSEFLEIEGYKCAACSDGKKGLDMILQHKFDVVLLDLAMPKFSGHDIVESLAKSGKIQDQNIIIFTASSVDSDDIHKLLKKGAKFCLKKPVQLDTLLSTLEGLGLYRR